MESKQKALIGLLKFASSSAKEAVKFAKETLSDLNDYEFRQFLRSVGYFAVDREEYFIREYNRLSENSIDDSKLSTIRDYIKQVENDFISYKNVKLITFRKPNEPRMKIAYDVLAGWVLKFLYQRYTIIPLNYGDGAGWLYIPNNTLQEIELWKQFLEWLPRDYIASNIETLLNLAVKKQIGQILVPSIYIDVIAPSLADLINKSPRYKNKFQASIRKRLNNAKTGAEKDALCKSVDAGSIKPPFQFSVYELETSPSRKGANKCIACEDSNAIPKMGTKLLLPESKQRDYDSIVDAQPALCSECFLAGFLSGLYPSSGMKTGYAICELPLSNLYETFFFAEQISGLTASLGVIQITNSSLLTILPSKYFVVQVSTGKGRLPKKTQLYLILKKYEKVFSDFEHVTVYISEAGPISSTRIHVPLLKLLAMFSGSILPPHYTTDGNQKSRANDAIQLLERGKPYTALYRLIYRVMQDKKRKIKYLRENNIFKSPLNYSNFDDTIINKGVKQFLTKRLTEGGVKMLKEDPKEFYEDVKDLSERIYILVKPIAENEVKKSKSNVSVIVRKYTNVVKYSTPQLNLQNLQYFVAQRADRAERIRLGGEQVFVEGKDKVQARLNEIESKILELYDKYCDRANMYLWREFIKEVEARLLSKLLLNIRGVGGV